METRGAVGLSHFYMYACTRPMRGHRCEASALVGECPGKARRLSLGVWNIGFACIVGMAYAPRLLYLPRKGRPNRPRAGCLPAACATASRITQGRGLLTFAHDAEIAINHSC